MRRASVILLTLLASAHARAMHFESCRVETHNRAETRAAIAAFDGMTPPRLTAPAVYLCRRIPSYGCGATIQDGVPLKVRLTPEVSLDFTTGVPAFSARRYWFFAHYRAHVLGSDGSLRDAAGAGPAGYVRTRGRDLVALLTTPHRDDDANLVTVDGRTEHVRVAFVCAPRVDRK